MGQKKQKVHSWLHQKYLLVLRNDETLGERLPLRGSGRQLLLLGLMLVVFVAIVAALLSLLLYVYWQDNYSIEARLRKQLMQITRNADSLSRELIASKYYAHSLRAVFGGDTTYLKQIAFLDTTTSEIKIIPISQRDSVSINWIDYEPSLSLDKPPSAHAAVLPSPFEAEDQALAALLLFPPLNGYISDRFQASTAHYGIDLLAPEGTSVQAVAAGVVVFASWTEDSGYVLVLQHTHGLMSLYKHNARLLKNVGDYVKQADPIALIGNTGNLSSGPHLHFELWHNKQAVDPQHYINF